MEKPMIIDVILIVIGFILGSTTVSLLNRRQFKNVYGQIDKLRGQVYYWSRQMPVSAKRGRPRKTKSVK